MKLKIFLGLACVAMAFATGLVPSSSGQAGGEDPLLKPLIDELSQQQAAIVENQAAIDAKLAGIAENIRLARIFSARGGGNETRK